MIKIISSTVYTSRSHWYAERPHTLVVACSDGRLQESIDEFLKGHLGIVAYDRLYAPGGPGVLVSGSYEYLRGTQFRREFDFLIDTHEIEQVIMIFHSAAEDGPEAAVCADYRRKMPDVPSAEVMDKQEDDARNVLRRILGSDSPVKVKVYRAEVMADFTVRFVQLEHTQSPQK